MPQVWDTPPARASGAAAEGGGARSGGGRPLVALVAADALDIDAVEDHLQLAGRQLQGAGVGRRVVVAASLQPLVPDAHAVPVPVKHLNSVGFAIEEDEQAALKMLSATSVI